MDFGGIAFINSDHIRVPSHIFRPLNIDTKSKLTGIFYPMPDTEEYRDVKPKKYDFLFTPVPYPIWPFTSRLFLRMNEEIGSMHAVTEILADNNYNILFANCYQVGHRYWHLAMFLEDLNLKEKYRKKLMQLSSKAAVSNCQKHLQSDLHDSCHSLRRIISRSVSKKLFKYGNDYLEWGEAIVCKSTQCLPYHFWDCEKKKIEAMDTNENDEGLLNPFITDTYYDKAQQEYLIKLPDYSSVFYDKIREIAKMRKEQSIIPTFGFIKIDEREAWIRINIIPKQHIEYFRRLIVKYERKSTGYSRGFLQKITSLIMDHSYNLHNVMDQTWANLDSREEGKVELIIEDKERGVQFEDDILHIGQEIDSKIKETLKFECHTEIKHIYPYRVFISHLFDSPMHNQLRKVCEEVGEEIGLLDAAFIVTKTHTQSALPMVEDGMRQSNGVLQFYINDQNKGDNAVELWLTVEYAMASIQDLPIIRIVDDKTVPLLESGINDIRITNLFNKSEVKEKVREALMELIAEMKKSRNQLIQA